MWSELGEDSLYISLREYRTWDCWSSADQEKAQIEFNTLSSLHSCKEDNKVTRSVDQKLALKPTNGN